MKRTISTVLITVSLMSACSSETSTKANPPTTVATTTPTVAPAAPSIIATSPPTTTTLSTTTIVPLETVFQALIDPDDAAVADILADPRVASDPSNPKVVSYLALFPAAGTFTGTALKFWAEEGTKGRFYRPGPGGAISKSTVMKVTSISEAEASFDICVVKSTTILDSVGNVLESSGGVAAGTIVAVKVDGGWLIRDLTRTPADACPKPGAAG